MAALRSRDAEKRIEALSAIEGRVTPAMLDPLVGILRSDMNPMVRALAADRLGTLGAEEALEELRESAERDKSWVVKRRALRALADILGEGVERDLQGTLNDESNETVRAEAVKLAAEQLSGDSRNELLLQALRDESRSVRVLAQVRLREITGKDYAPEEYSRWEEALSEPDAGD